MFAVLYAAKSTKDEKESIPTQLEECRRKAENEGRGIAAEFTDEAASAWSGDRGDGLEVALAKVTEIVAEHGEAELWVWKSERLARGSGKKDEARSLLEVYTRCKRAGVVLRSVLDDAYVQDEAMIGMASKMANKYSEDLSEAVKAGKRRSRKEGIAQGGVRRFGFERFSVGMLRPVPAEIRVVDRILDELLAGRSYSMIARDLEAERVPTVAGGGWHQARVAEIARNPIYVGKLKTKDGVLEGAHDAVVDPDKWQRVQDVLAAKAARSSGRGRPSSGRHLFRKGMLRCGCCGGSMVPRTTRREGKQPYEVYYCYERRRDPTMCGQGSIQREAIDSAVYRYFEAVALDVDATRAQLEAVQARKLEEVRGLHELAERERQRAEERLLRVRRDYADGHISAADWADLRAELEPQLAAASAEVERLVDQRAEIEAWDELRDVESEALAKLAEIRSAVSGEISDAIGVDAVRAALGRLFDHFVVREPAPGQRVHARLAWVDGLVIEPVARPQAVAGYSSLRPVFRRVPLYDAEATIKGSPD